MVKLTFVGKGSQPVQCAGEAAVTVGEQIRQVLGGLSLAYGEQVQGEFLDLDAASCRDHPLVQECLEHEYLLPVLFIDNQMRFQGGIPILALKSLLDGMGLQTADLHRKSRSFGSI